MRWPEKTKTKTKQNKQGGFRAKWGGPSGHLTWPLNPPKKTKKTKQNPKNKQKKQKKEKTKKEKVKKHKNTKKRAFQLSVKIFLFLTGCPKIAFFDTLAQKMRTPKHYKNRGFSLFFEKSYASRNGRFWTKTTQIQKFQLSLFLPFFSFKNKNTKSCWNPYFYSVLANLEKRIFQKNNLKHRKLKNPIFAPFFEKGYL